ncbi:MAG TPA: HAD-IC family P-type ATPase, partial [Dermatophilaceae bacterium]|nr:HAD-IC family P-type ATPase [Dermatophilaceae bacterium]HPK90394.1 HAD-IC family P-type ATPase [Dermatophilaceae bacterium]HQG12204.1 HAD-IC family P-type ATPase [Dermatophilaceae bacterium]HQH91360.1 HAD-IC family P-type ATPase [Dermatophilaceae bacterium]HQK61379.1 HAD-IC family P-type ATPase [Dermatophilaceae bacterium]
MDQVTTHVGHPGLTSAEVADRVRDGRTNDMPARSGRSTGEIVRANVLTRINAILGILLVIVLTTGKLINAAFGLLIIANSAIGIIQELRAKRTLDNLAVIGEARPTVRRDGVSRPVTRTDIVADDVIELGPGDQLIVDGDVLEAASLEVDESLLTGEADPVVKGPGDQVLSGSFVVAGSGAYRATKVGREAYAARIVEEAAKFTLVGSELRDGINRILLVVSWLLVPVGLLTIWTQLFGLGQPWREGLTGMVAALVPMVPEGLVLMTSIAFAVGVIRLGQRQCLVQELPAIEGLARVDVVCADKTGTLTESGMRLSEVRGFDGSGMPSGPAPAEVTEILAQLTATEPNPNASLAAIAEAIAAPSVIWTETHHAPFTSARKWSGSTFDGQGTWVLGAPDVLAPEGSAAREAAEEIGASGLRVLLLAEGSLPVTDPAAPGTVTPAALVILEQRVRPDARGTLEFFAEQHVQVKVISGDNARSVGAVTTLLGVVGGSDPIDARTLSQVDPDDAQTHEGQPGALGFVGGHHDDQTTHLSEAFVDAVARHTVFGRVTPDQKRAMVLALKSRGHTVAMTGDGVNDVLALKKADIGVAMGAGSPATRAVAQIVLLDNKFATLPYVVAEGRRVIGNIERVANLFLTKTVYSVLIALLVGIWQLPFPLQPIHVTITGWFTIGVPAFLLSLAPNHERARPGFARRVLQLALPSGVVVAICTFTTYLLCRPPVSSGEALRTQASTASLACLIIVATWVLSVVARPYEWWKVALLVSSVAAYVAIFLVPFTQSLFLLDAGNAAMMRTGLTVGL